MGGAGEVASEGGMWVCVGKTDDVWQQEEEEEEEEDEDEDENEDEDGMRMRMRMEMVVWLHCASHALDTSPSSTPDPTHPASISGGDSMSNSPPPPWGPPLPTTSSFTHISRTTNPLPKPHIPRPAPIPSSPTTTLTLHNFRITTTKLPICNSPEIESMTKTLGITLPEMIFGNNDVRVEYLGPSPPPPPPVMVEEGGWRRGGVVLVLEDALDLVDKTGANGMLKVAYSESWQRQRENVHGARIKEYVRPFDWSYTTSYRGTVLPCPSSPTPSPPATTTGASTTTTNSNAMEGKKYEFLLEPPSTTLPTSLLLLPDPILLFNELVLYEDELADNGISLYSVKLRVMPHRMLILARFFLRLDDVLFRLRDTRVYIDFAVPGALGEGGKGGSGRPTVWREYVEKEGEWGFVVEQMRREGVRGSEVAGALRDAGRVERWLVGVGTREMERVVLG
ncbi:TIP41-like family-domain-containing protein [Terfezia claveryi]|nr:TIP41-like family-domain-containing protein [Terfezia claveryi]